MRFSLFLSLLLLLPACENNNVTGGAAGDGGANGYGGGGGEGGRAGQCGATHPKVGWVAKLQGKLHNVSGTAAVVDDCTIRIENFTFDGGGIDVRIYGGTNGDYKAGYAMTGDLRPQGAFNGATLKASLPVNKSLDDLDGISVWCVAVGVDFGSGTFSPP